MQKSGLYLQSPGSDEAKNVSGLHQMTLYITYFSEQILAKNLIVFYHHVGHRRLSMTAQTELGAHWTGTVEQFFLIARQLESNGLENTLTLECQASGNSAHQAGMLCAKTSIKHCDDGWNWSMLWNNAQ